MIHSQWETKQVLARVRRNFPTISNVRETRWSMLWAPIISFRRKKIEIQLFSKVWRGSFLTCSFIDRIQGLQIVQNSDQLELLLTGAVFVVGGLLTLELADFVTTNSSEQLSTASTVLPFQNRPLVAVLKNFQCSSMSSFLIILILASMR